VECKDETLVGSNIRIERIHRFRTSGEMNSRDTEVGLEKLPLIHCVCEEDLYRSLLTHR